MITTPRLRPIAPDDEPFLRRLYAETRQSDLGPLSFLPPDQLAVLLDMQYRAREQAYRSSYPTATFDVILLAESAMGRLSVDRASEQILIVEIALLKAERGAGHGTYVIRALLDEAASSGRSVRLHVEHKNPAVRLYERLGFRVTGDHGVYAAMEWTRAS